MPELRQRLADELKNRCKLEYDWQTELLITVGVSEALDLTMRAVINPGRGHHDRPGLCSL